MKNMQKRERLADGTTLGTYTIAGYVGEGRNALTYKALTGSTFCIIKEYFPGFSQGKPQMTRAQDGISVIFANTYSQPEEQQIKDKIAHIVAIEQENISRVRHLDENNNPDVFNATLLPEGIIPNTLARYMVIETEAGECLDQVDFSTLETAAERIVDKLNVIKNIATTVNHIHTAGLLHCDLKPANIYLSKQSLDIRQRPGDRCAILLDYGSALPMEEEVVSCTDFQRVTYSPGYAAPELTALKSIVSPRQFQERIQSIGPHTDVYALVVILAELLCGKHTHTPWTDVLLTEDMQAMPQSVRDELQALFNDIRQDVESRKKVLSDTTALVHRLEALISLVERRPYLAPQHISGVPNYFGRTEEQAVLSSLLEDHRIAFICGMAGIGKSELSGQYYLSHKEKYTHVVRIYYIDDLADALMTSAPVNNVYYPEGESRAAQFERYFCALCNVVNSKTLFIIENFNTKDDKNLQRFLGLDAHFIFSSRHDFTKNKRYGQCAMHLQPERDLAALKNLFYHHAPKRLRGDHQAEKQVEELIQVLHKHTLAIILSASQLSECPLISLEALLARMTDVGINTGYTTEVDHYHDDELHTDVAYGHIKALFNFRTVTTAELDHLKVLCYVPYSGVNDRIYLARCGYLGDDAIVAYNSLSSLIRSNWVNKDEETSTLSLHPIISEVVWNEVKPSVEEKYFQNYLMVLIGDYYNYLIREFGETDSLNSEKRLEFYSAQRFEIMEITHEFYAPPMSGLYLSDIERAEARNLFSFIAKRIFERTAIAGYFLIEIATALNNIFCSDEACLIAEQVEKIYRELYPDAICPTHERDSVISVYDRIAAIHRSKGDTAYSLKHTLKNNPHQKGFSSDYNQCCYTVQKEFTAEIAAIDQKWKFQRCHEAKNVICDRSSDHEAKGNALIRLENYDEALENYLQELAILKQLSSNKASDRLAACYTRIAKAQYSLSRYEESIDALEMAVSIRKNRAYSETCLDLLKDYSLIGFVLEQLSYYERALKAFQEALVIRERRVSDEKRFDPENIVLATDYIKIGNILSNLSRYEEALYYYQQALKTQKERLPHGSQSSLVHNYFNIGNTLSNLLNHEDALESYQQALILCQHRYPEGDLGDLATSYNNVGYTLCDLSRQEEALEYFQYALSIWKELYPDELHPSLASCLNNIACTLNELSRYEEALENYQQLLFIQKQLYPDAIHTDLGDTYCTIGSILYALSSYEEALENFHHALHIWKQLPLEDVYPDLTCVYQNIASTLGQLSRYEEALENYQQLLFIRKQLYPDGIHDDVASNYFSIGCTLYACCQYEAAMKNITQALFIQKQLYTSEINAAIATSYSTIGKVLVQLLRYEEALEHYQHAFEIRKALYPDGMHFDLFKSYHYIGRILEILSRHDEAQKYSKQAQRIQDYLNLHLPQNWDL